MVRAEAVERLNQVVCEGAAYGAVTARDKGGGASNCSDGGGGGVEGACRTMELVLVTEPSVALREVVDAGSARVTWPGDCCVDRDCAYDDEERSGGGGTVSIMDGGRGGGGGGGEDDRDSLGRGGGWGGGGGVVLGGYSADNGGALPLSIASTFDM